MGLFLLGDHVKETKGEVRHIKDRLEGVSACNNMSLTLCGW
jgi:hypothetical protein